MINLPQPNLARKRQILGQLHAELAYYRTEGCPSAKLAQLEARVARRMRGLSFLIRSRQPRRVRKVAR